MQQIGRYNVLQSLKSGGMGEILLVELVGSENVSQTFAMKLAKKDLQGVSADHFIYEAKLAAQLHHENVVRIVEFGRDEQSGRYYLVMEYVDGPTLKGVIETCARRKEPVPVLEATKLVSLVCAGLSYVHQAKERAGNRPLNVIHQDVTPENILLSTTGGVKLVDFGIAQWDMDPTPITGGKDGYMAPEQQGGGPIDNRVDVYQLGLVMYELLTGRKAYPNDATKVEPVPVRDLRPDAPAELGRITHKAMARDREARYQACAQMLKDLDSFLVESGEPMGSSQLADFVRRLGGETRSLWPARGPGRSQAPGPSHDPAPPVSLAQDGFAGPKILLDRIKTTQRPVIFLIGSGITIPDARPSQSRYGASSTAEVIQRIRSELQDSPGAVEELERALAVSADRFQSALQVLSQWRHPDSTNRLIQASVLEACSLKALQRAGVRDSPRPTLLDVETGSRLENDLDGWHYPRGIEVLGQLIRLHPKKLHTVLTTNLDPLLEMSIRKAGGRTHSTIVNDDLNLEAHYSPEGCHVVHLHGYWLGGGSLYSPPHSRDQRRKLLSSLTALFQGCTVVALGFSGQDPSVEEILNDLTAEKKAHADILWCFHSADRADIQRRYGPLLELLRLLEKSFHAKLFAGIDAQTFLPELLTAMGGEPQVLPAITQSREATASDQGQSIIAGRESEKSALEASLANGNPIQLLGPPGMGKTTLLEWAERLAGVQGHPKAFIDARGSKGRSAAELVLAVGRALGRGGDIHVRLDAASARPDARAAARVFRELVQEVTQQEASGRLCLLVNHADSLAEKDHDFDRGFFEVLRGLCEERKLVWISASWKDLFGLFRQTGLTSEFLNDSLKLHVGRLRHEDVANWLIKAGVAQERVAFAYGLSGGVPEGLRWLASKLAQGSADLSAMPSVFSDWIRPLFRQWWTHLTPSERGRLRRCLGDGVEIASLEEEDKRAVREGRPSSFRLLGLRGLVASGFLAEEEGRFRLSGSAWHDFVRLCEVN